MIEMTLLFFLLISILIAIFIFSLLTFLNINKKSSGNSSQPSILTIDCNDNPIPRNLSPPSSFPFNLKTNGLGGGSFSLLYYNVRNPSPPADTPIDVNIFETQTEPIEIIPPTGTQGIQYVFTCNKVPVPLTGNTPSPVSINPYIPYQFVNGNSIQNMTVALTDVNGAPSTLGPITAVSSAAPNPSAGYNSYSATFS